MLLTDSAPGLFRYRRRLQWGDGDAAQIGYTSSQLDVFLEAVDDWWRQIVGIDWYRLNTERGLGSPCVHVDLDFGAPVTPGQELVVTVTLAELGRSSMTFGLAAETLAGARCFTGTTVHVLVDRAAMRAVPIPPDLRAPMERYRAASAA